MIVDDIIEENGRMKLQLADALAQNVILDHKLVMLKDKYERLVKQFESAVNILDMEQIRIARIDTSILTE